MAARSINLFIRNKLLNDTLACSKTQFNEGVNLAESHLATL